MNSSAPFLSLLPAPSLSASEASVDVGLATHLPALRRRARQLTKNLTRADDLVQDTVERALRFKHTFREGGHLKAWLLRIMHNVFISERRRVATEHRVLAGAGVDPNGWAALRPTTMSPGLSPRVSRALEAMPDHLRSVVDLVDLKEHSYKDAALAEDVPVGTIMSRLHRGRTRLAQELGPVAA